MAPTFAADPASLERFARSVAIPRRQGASVAGLMFVSNLVLHSGVDDPSGHFLAAYEERNQDGCRRLGESTEHTFA